MTNLYGIESTDDVQFDRQGLPIGTYKVMIVGEEAAKEDKGVVVEYEILDGDYKGKTGKQWILTKHENPQTANIAKQTLKRIAEATGKAVTPASPLKNRVLTIEVAQQKKNPDYTEVKRFLPEDHKPVEQTPF